MKTKSFTYARYAANWVLGLALVAVMLFSAVSPAYAAGGGIYVQAVGVAWSGGSVTYGTPGNVSYTISVTCAGGGTGATWNPALTGVLPSGVTYDFNPTALTWGQNCNGAPLTQNSTLTLHTTASTPGGVTGFTVSVGGVSNSTGALTVHGIALTVQGFVPNNKPYDGTSNATVFNYGSLSSGVIYPDQVFLDHSSVGATFADKNVQNGKLVTAYGYALTGAQASNYTLVQPTNTANITKATLHIYMNVAGASKVYDGTTDAYVTFSTDKISGDEVIVSGTGKFDTRDVGSNKTVSPFGVSISGADAGNYNVDLSLAPGLANITARPITVSAAADSKQYDGTASSSAVPTITSGTLAAGDTFGFAQAFDTKDVGTGKVISVTGSVSDGNSGKNYDIAVVPASGSISARPVSVTADAQAKVYGALDPALSYQITAGSLASGDAFSGSLARASGEDIGSYGITQGSLALSSNYNLNFVGASLVISARPLTVAADAKSKVYGASDPALTYQITAGSLASGDALSGSLVRASGEDVGSYGISQGSLALIGNPGNYNFNFIGANLSITRRPITSVTADNQIVNAHDPLPAFTFQYAAGDLAPAETQAAIDTAPTCGVAVSNPPPGSYPITCSGGSDPNYDFSGTVYFPGTLTINGVANTNTFISNGATDGWILESGQFTNVGGTMNSKAVTFRVGDDIANKQYKAVLSFDTSSLPDNASISSVSIRVMKQKIVGGTKIFTMLKGLVVDMTKPSFGKPGLQLGDFKVKPAPTAGTMLAGTFGPTADSNGWYTVNLNPTAYQFINLGGTTEFRLRFGKADNNNKIANYLLLYSGNALNPNMRPQLIITYSYP